ncbi:MAG: signal transduction histidine kinase [Paenibacillus sp.]|nr:signal transduction histidine kinase [Paenibacillus sp.]
MNYFYILIFLSLWTMGLVLLTHNRKANFWISTTLATGGMASFAFSVHLTIVPLLLPRGWLSPLMGTILYEASVVAMTIYFYLFPFAACMGALWLSGIRSGKARMLVSALLALPVAAALGEHLRHQPWGHFDIDGIRTLAAFYFIISFVFYYLAVKLEKDMHKKKNKRRVGILFSFGTLYPFFTDFVGFRSLTIGHWRFDLESNGAWQYNVVVILGLVAIITYFLVKNGFMGIKLRIEQEKMDVSMRALTMGVSILNHSIKNEIQKINYLTEKTEGYIQAGQSDKSLQSIEQIHSVTAHMLNMVGRIKDKAEDIVLTESRTDIRDLLEEVLQPMQPLLENSSVQVSIEYESDGHLVADATHLKETLSNLIQNALDAMPAAGGKLTLRSFRLKRHYLIEVKDNGSGIPKDQLGKIFEPFYTTKKNAYNHGLGLPYCASVLWKHGGKLTVAASDSGRGTTVTLQFPGRRFIAADALPADVAADPLKGKLIRLGRR